MGNYDERDGLKYLMEQRWIEGQAGQFPADIDNCIKKFKQIESELDQNYHPLVNWGAAVNKAGLLTDHGPEHVQTVMRRALQIIGNKRVDLLTGYEIFVLLLAIHFHDLGNIYGREEHEQKIFDVMQKMGGTLPLNIIDQEFIRAVATAHGGFCDDLKTDRDTIHSLKPIEYRDSILIRPAVLASILRFADEISDDFTRAVKNIDIPPENQIFHAFANSLEVNIEGNVIRFRYRIPFKDTQYKMQKGTEKKYLYDEIKERLQKCFYELEYCRKYSDGFIGITTINVVIYIIKEQIGATKQKSHECMDEFCLRLHGYPRKFEMDNFIERYGSDGKVLPNQRLKYASGKDLKSAAKMI